jgi:hypothetical protein
MKPGVFHEHRRVNHQTHFRVVTFFYDKSPEESRYADSAVRLLDACDALRVSSSIFGLSFDSSGVSPEWPAITLHKPLFLNECLSRFAESILWIDADSYITEDPTAWVPSANTDFAGFARNGDFIGVTQGRWARIFQPGVLYFGQTDASRRLVTNLSEAAATALNEEKNVTDDYVLQETMLKHGSDLRITFLPRGLLGNAVVHGVSGSVALFRDQVIQHTAPAKSLTPFRIASVLELHRAAAGLAAQRRLSGVYGEYFVAKFISVLLRFALVVTGRISLPNWRRKPGTSACQVGSPSETGQSEVTMRNLRRTKRDVESTAVFWWRGPSTGNLGDGLSPILVRQLLKTEIAFADKGRRLFGIGSILKFADSDSIVWGTGFSSPSQSVGGRPQIYAVRGPRTHEILTRQGLRPPSVFGDPALLVPSVFSEHIDAAEVVTKISGERRMCIVPHVLHFSNAEREINFVRNQARVDFIDFRVTGCDPIIQTMKQLAQAEHIFSSSLHGLILAHSFGVPATWIELDEQVYGRISGGRFKFFDYFESIGAENHRPVTLARMSDLSESMADPVVLTRAKLAEMQGALRLSLRLALEDD